MINKDKLKAVLKDKDKLKAIIILTVLVIFALFKIGQMWFEYNAQFMVIDYKDKSSVVNAIEKLTVEKIDEIKINKIEKYGDYIAVLCTVDEAKEYIRLIVFKAKSKGSKKFKYHSGRSKTKFVSITYNGYDENLKICAGDNRDNLGAYYTLYGVDCSYSKDIKDRGFFIDIYTNNEFLNGHFDTGKIYDENDKLNSDYFL